MEPEEGFDDDEPASRWLPPDDRLWRHPSEITAHPPPAALTLAHGGGREPRAITIAVLSGLISSLLTAGLIAVAGGFEEQRVPVRSVEREAPRTVQPVSSVTGSVDNVVAIAERLRPAIVQLEISGNAIEGTGSGVLFRDDGHVLTNHHVIDGADDITVVMSDGKEHEADLVGGDPETDIAVVKIDGGGFPTAALGTAAGLKVGHQAIAIGSPLGLAGGPSLSVGVVSALGRQVESREGPPLLDMIQTDAPIAPGSSGGALLDAGGAVIGITTAIAVSDVGAEGLGFATPIDIARDVAEQLITTGEVSHVWLGIEGEDGDGGALVRRVRAGSPAAEAGIRARDVITSLEGRPVTSMGALVVSLRSRRPGQEVRIGITRDGSPLTVTATLAERPKNL
jgi:S1-C subfamily serine protease